jgi:hypothetical protein
MDGHSVYFRNTDAITKYVTVHELAHIIDYNSSVEWAIYYLSRTVKSPQEPSTFSTAWGIYTTNYSHCWKCVQKWERWAEAVSLYVYGANYPYDGARFLEPWEWDIMNRLLLGHGW